MRLGSRKLRSFACAIVAALVGSVLAVGGGADVARGAAPTSTPVTITESAGDPNRTGDNVSTEAHDGSLETGTFTTPSGNTLEPSHLMFGFDSTPVNRIRIYKNTDYGPHNLDIQYTTGSDALAGRAWTNVSGLTNGYLGTELLTATTVNANGSVTGDAHNSFSTGFASLTFDDVTATGLRISFSGGECYCKHYHVFEFEAHYFTEAPSITSGDSDSFAIGVAEDFTVTSAGRPAAALTTSSALPDGVTFTDNGDGTASLAGTPAVGSDGDYPLTITAANGVGSNDVQNFTLTVVDLFPPPVVTSTTPDVIGNDPTPLVHGTVTPGQDVFVLSGDCSGELGYADVDGEGDWSFQTTSNLPEGGSMFSAVAIEGGDVSRCSNVRTYTLDTGAPSAPSITGTTPASRGRDRTPTIDGTAEPEADVDVSIGNDDCSSETVLGTASADGEGDWSLPLIDGSDDLDEGLHRFTARQTDAAGNTSTCSNAVTYEVDLTPPTITIDSGPDGTATADDTPTFTWTAGTGAIITCAVDAQAVACDSGSSHTTAPLGGGAHSFAVTATDDVGNASTDDRTFTVDAQGPVVTISAPGKTTKRRPKVKFTAVETPVTFYCQLDGSGYSVCTSPFQPSSNLKFGKHTVDVYAVDQLGNVGATASKTIKVIRR